MKKLSYLLIFAALVFAALHLPMAPAQAQGNLPIAHMLCDQFLRSQPDDTSIPLALLRPGEPTLSIVGHSQDNYWLVAVRQNGQVGWIANTACIWVEGLIANAPWTAAGPAYSGPVQASLFCDQTIFSAPRDDAARLVRALDPDMLGVMRVDGRNEGSTWLFITSQDRSVTGWLFNSADCVIIYGDVATVPVVTTEMPIPGAAEANPALVTPVVPPTIGLSCPQSIRSAPNVEAARLTIFQPEDGLLNVIGRDYAGNWALVQRADGEMGWTFVGTSCVTIYGDILNAPVRIDITMPVPGQTAATPALTVPSGTAPTMTLSCTQYIRSAPNDTSARLLILYPTDGVLEILGRDQFATWLLVQRADGAMGWVLAGTTCVNIQGDVFSVPLRIDVVMPVPGQPLPPTPLPLVTPMPSPTPQTEPVPFPGAVAPTPTATP